MKPTSLGFTALQHALHWAMAAAILAMLFIGVGMVSTVHPIYVRLLATHEALGIAILVLALIRLITRLRDGAPGLPTDLPAALKLAATASHYLLYTLMILMPLLGWAMLSSANYPLAVGHWTLPALVPVSEELHGRLWLAHMWLGLSLFALVSLHIAAALFHALVRRDGVFGSMLFRQP
jgi:cytochrome b561